VSGLERSSSSFSSHKAEAKRVNSSTGSSLNSVPSYKTSIDKFL
jgi:hypothetical protein